MIEKIPVYNFSWACDFNFSFFKLKSILKPSVSKSGVFNKHNFISHYLEIDKSKLKEEGMLIKGGTNILDDIYLLLTLISSRYVYGEGHNFHLIPNGVKIKHDLNLLMPGEIEDFINKYEDFKKDRMFPVLRESLNFYIYQYFNSDYIQLGQINKIHGLESLLGRIYAENYPDKNMKELTEVKLERRMKYSVDEYFKYGSYLRKGIKILEIDANKYNTSIMSQKNQFIGVRNWMQHGRIGSYPVEFLGLPSSNNEFTFFRKVDSLVRLMLIDLLNEGQEYKRKFYYIWSLILENNVAPLRHLNEPNKYEIY